MPPCQPAPRPSALLIAFGHAALPQSPVFAASGAGGSAGSSSVSTSSAGGGHASGGSGGGGGGHGGGGGGGAWWRWRGRRCARPRRLWRTAAHSPIMDTPTCIQAPHIQAPRMQRSSLPASTSPSNIRLPIGCPVRIIIIIITTTFASPSSRTPRFTTTSVSPTILSTRSTLRGIPASTPPSRTRAAGTVTAPNP